MFHEERLNSITQTHTHPFKYDCFVWIKITHTSMNITRLKSDKTVCNGDNVTRF